MALRLVMIEFLWIFVLNVALPPVEGCGWNTTALNGTIESPNFPNKYPDGQTCVYIITAPRNHRVTLTFTHFDVEAHAGCPMDFVEIRDGDGQSSNLLGRFCDNSLPGPVRTFSNQMRIKFVSDGSVTRSGFRATFTSDVDQFPFFLIASTVRGLRSGGSIFRVDVETRSNLPIPMASPPLQPFAVDYDPVQQTIYWTEVGDIFKGIRSSFLNGSHTTIVRNLSSGSLPRGLAVDPLSRLVFYTDTGRDVIAMITMSTLAHRTVIDSGLDQPQAIVLDTVNGVMFWTDWGENPKIERANYDGTDRRTLHEDILLYPNALALDVANSRLYWVDAGTDQVEMSDLDGDGRTTLLTIHSLEHHFFGLALFENALYITDWGKLGTRSNSSQLIRLKLDGSKNTIVYGSITSKRLNDIHAYSPQVSSDSSSMNGCSNKNGGCAVICVPLPRNNSRCLCPDGQRLTRDQRTCVNGSYQSIDTFVLQTSVPVIGGAVGGVVLLIVNVILIACIVVVRRRGRERYARPSNPRQSVSQEHDYSQLGAPRSPARVIQPYFPNEMFGDRPSSDNDDVENNVRSSNYETLDNVAAELLALPDDYLTPTVSEQQACPEKTVSDPVPCSWNKQSSSDSSYRHPIDSPGDLDDIPPTP